MGEVAPKRSRRGQGRWLSATGIRDRQGPERTNAKSFFGTHQKGTLQASAALGMDLPDCRSDCFLEESRLVSTRLGTELLGATQTEPSILLLLTEGGSVAGTVESIFLLFSICSIVVAEIPFALFWPFPRKSCIKLSKNVKIYKCNFFRLHLCIFLSTERV